MEHDQLSLEWRKSVMDRLTIQDTNLDKMRDDLTQIRLNTAQTSSLLQLDARLRSVEDFRLRTVTLLIIVQSILGALAIFLPKLLFH